MSRRQRLRSTLRGAADTVIPQEASSRSIPARALFTRRASCSLPRRRRPPLRPCSPGHRSSRSTSIRPSLKAWARNEGSASASLSSTTSTGRPTIRESFVTRSKTRSKLGSRRSTRTSTSLSGPSVPVAVEPNSSARRTFDSVRKPVRSAEINGQERLRYTRSDNGRSSVRGPSLVARRVPWFTARRKVRSLTPSCSANDVSSFMCPLYSGDVSAKQHAQGAPMSNGVSFDALSLCPEKNAPSAPGDVLNV